MDRSQMTAMERFASEPTTAERLSGGHEDVAAQTD